MLHIHGIISIDSLVKAKFEAEFPFGRGRERSKTVMLVKENYGPV